MKIRGCLVLLYNLGEYVPHCGITLTTASVLWRILCPSPAPAAAGLRPSGGTTTWYNTPPISLFVDVNVLMNPLL